MAYTDLDSIHVPTAGTRPPASWGAAVNENFDVTYDEVLSKLGQWTVHNTLVTQSVSVSRTVTYSRYLKIGRLVIWQFNLTITSSGTANNPIILTLPVNAAAINVGAGRMFWHDGTDFNGGDAYLASTSTMAALISTGFASILGQTTTGYPNQLLNTHILRGFLLYESAS